MNRKLSLLFVLLAICLGLSTAAFAQKGTVLRVVIVKTDNVQAYLDQLDKGTEVMKKLGVERQIHVWQATFAGPETGTVVAAIEYPSMSAYSADAEKLMASKEYLAWLHATDALRTIVSDSLYKGIR